MKRRPGYTLAELNLAILFVGLLVLGVAMTTIYLTRIYQKGLTVRTVNQLGREVSGQLRRDIAAAKPSNIKIEISADNHWGRLCLGNVSYIYNTAVGMADGDTIGTDDIYLVRAEDSGGDWCARAAGPAGGFIKNDFAPSDRYSELLSNDVLELAVHDLSLDEYEMEADTGLQSMYRLSMQIGTNEAETTAGGKCLPPTVSEANFDYCFISEFETVIRAGEVPE